MMIDLSRDTTGLAFLIFMGLCACALVGAGVVARLWKWR
jgi:hypothetical protein